jgi:hypothetical protein
MLVSNYFVNSFYSEGPCKTVEKLVTITNGGSDVLFMSDCRLGRGIEKVKHILLIGKRTSYDMYTNSTKGDRGVCIAISRNPNVEIIEEVKDTVSENCMLILCKIDNIECLLGCVYGPNINNRAFYRELIDKIEGSGVPAIIGGDFNTAICGDRGVKTWWSSR